MLALLAGLLAQAAVVASEAGVGTYVVDGARCGVAIHVGKAGLFRFAGHEHEVVATRCKGEIVANREDLSRSSVTLTFESAGLQVSEKGEPGGDAPKVQAAMLGPKLLDVARFPAVSFVSTAVGGRSTSAGTYAFEVTGELTLHGVTRALRVPVRVELQGDGLKAGGQLTLEQTAFGLAPISVAGVVKVKDQLSIDFEIAASRRN